MPAAIFEMFAIIAVLESLGAVRAIEGKFVEHVGYESVGFAAGRKGGPTVWAVFLFGRPIVDARLTV